MSRMSELHAELTAAESCDPTDGLMTVADARAAMAALEWSDPRARLTLRWQITTAANAWARLGYEDVKYALYALTNQLPLRWYGDRVGSAGQAA